MTCLRRRKCGRSEGRCISFVAQFVGIRTRWLMKADGSWGVKFDLCCDSVCFSHYFFSYTLRWGEVKEQL